MADLSSQAQAVLDAAIDAYWKESHLGRGTIAAALRAAADQVLPEEPEPQWWEPVRPRFNRQCLRRRFLAIAAELEGTVNFEED